MRAVMTWRREIGVDAKPVLSIVMAGHHAVALPAPRISACPGIGKTQRHCLPSRTVQGKVKPLGKLGCVVAADRQFDGLGSSRPQRPRWSRNQRQWKYAGSLYAAGCIEAKRRCRNPPIIPSMYKQRLPAWLRHLLVASASHRYPPGHGGTGVLVSP